MTAVLLFKLCWASWQPTIHRIIHLCLWLCPSLPLASAFCLSSSLFHLLNTSPHPGCKERKEEMRIQLSFGISLEHLVGSVAYVSETDIPFPFHDRFGIQIIKEGFPPFSWESSSLRPNISSDFIDAQTHKSWMRRNLQEKEDDQIASGSLLDNF